MRHRKFALALLAGAMALGLLAGTGRQAAASVVYQQSGSVFSADVSFTYTAPAFITGDLTVLAASLTGTAPGISSVDFLPDCPTFGGCNEVAVHLGLVNAFIGYPTGAFTTPGIYDRGSVNLTVTEIAAIPVPASALLFGAGLLGLAVVRRHPHA